MNEKYYIAYGSNLSLSNMKACCPSAKKAGVTQIVDYELLFKGNRGHFFLTIEPKKGSIVPAGIWKIAGSDQRQLDRYEGYPTLYYKTTMELPMGSLTAGNIILVTAFVYIMYEDFPCGVPDKRYYNICLNGYDDFGFNPKYLKRAVETSRQRAEGKELKENKE